MKLKVKKIVAILIVILILITILLLNFFNNKKLKYINYKQFNNEIENGNIQSVWIEDDKINFLKIMIKVYIIQIILIMMI